MKLMMRFGLHLVVYFTKSSSSVQPRVGWFDLSHFVKSILIFARTEVCCVPVGWLVMVMVMVCSSSYFHFYWTLVRYHSQHSIKIRCFLSSGTSNKWMRVSQSVSVSNENLGISVASVSSTYYGLKLYFKKNNSLLLLAMSLSTESEKSRVIKAYKTEITRNN